jgi:putative hydrolase of the HAD superfamily
MENLKGIKAITFDFWGVFAAINPPMNEYVRKQGIELDKYAKEIHNHIKEHDLGKITERQFLQRCSKILGVEIPYPEYRYVYKDATLNKDLMEVVRKLREKYKIALLSNNNEEYSKEYLFRPGLDKLFDVLVLSYQVGYRKPDPEIYRILIKRLDLKPEEILFLDDDPTKLPPAEEQGIKTLVYKWGETDKVLFGLL